MARRVLYCADVSGKGGALRHREAVVRLLARSGWEVDRVEGVSRPLRRVRAGAERAVRRGTLHRLVGSAVLLLNSAERFLGLVLRSVRRRPQVLLWRPGLFQFHGWLAAAVLRVPLVVELNAPAVQEAERFGDYAFAALAARIERRVLAAASRVVAVSDENAAHAGADGRCTVVPNGGGFIDEAEVRAAAAWARERCPLCASVEHGPVAVVIESFRGWHGDAERRAAVSALPPGWTTVVLGDGPGRADFLEWAASTHGGGVLAPGRVAAEGVQHVLYSHADLGFVLYAPMDGFYFSPLKLFDLLAHGVPVVATDIGQVGTVGREADTVELVRPGDLDALARTVHATAERIVAERWVRNAAPRRPETVLGSRYGWPHAVGGYARVLDEVRGTQTEGCEGSSDAATVSFAWVRTR